MATTEENLAQMAGVARTDLSGTGPKGKGKVLARTTGR